MTTNQLTNYLRLDRVIIYRYLRERKFRSCNLEFENAVLMNGWRKVGEIVTTEESATEVINLGADTIKKPLDTDDIVQLVES